MSDAGTHPYGGSSLSPEVLVARSFPSARKGFDPTSVRAALEEAAAQLRAFAAREAELQARLTEAEARLAAPTFDERTLSAAVGSETARILQTAHEAAREVLEGAERRAAELVGDAETRLERATTEAEAARAAVLQRSERDARERREHAETEARQMIDEARLARRKILSDLAEKRRTLHLQLEQLRAGKDALIAVIDQASGAVGAIRNRLDDAEGLAQLAAGEAGRLVSIDQPIEEAVREALASIEHLEIPTEDPGDPSPRDDDLDAAPVGTTGPDASNSDGSLLAAEELDGETGKQDGSDPETGNAVEELFARIRASREQASAEALAVLSGPPGPTEEVVPPPKSGDAGSAPGRPEAAARDEAAAPAAASSHADPRGSAATAPPVEGGDETARDEGQASGSDPLHRPDLMEEADEAAPSETDPLIEARDELLGPCAGEVTRTLKRVLREEQNEVLDAIRQARSSEALSGLLPGEATAKRLAEETAPHLAAAFSSGVRFAEEHFDGTPRRSRKKEADPSEAALVIGRQLGDEIVATITSRVGAEAVANDDTEALSDKLGSAFRELRGPRLERVAEGFAVRAFCNGELETAIRLGAQVSWFVDDAGGSCAECDDNQVSGPQSPNEPFPTGHRFPPVHEGCRCFLALSAN